MLSATAQIVDSQNSANIAQWNLNASVSATGEQIEYHYRAEDEQSNTSVNNALSGNVLSVLIHEKALSPIGLP